VSLTRAKRLLTLGKQLILIKPECLSAKSNKLTATNDDLIPTFPGTRNKNNDGDDADRAYWEKYSYLQRFIENI